MTKTRYILGIATAKGLQNPTPTSYRGVVVAVNSAPTAYFGSGYPLLDWQRANAFIPSGATVAHDPSVNQFVLAGGVLVGDTRPQELLEQAAMDGLTLPYQPEFIVSIETMGGTVDLVTGEITLNGANVTAKYTTGAYK